MLRIGIEALGISQYGGGRTATLNLLRSLLAIDKSNEYDIYLDSPEPSLKGLNSRTHQHIVSVKNRFLARLVLQALLPVEMRRRHINLVHFMKGQIVPLTGTKTLVTIYDLTTLRHPEAYPAIDVWYWQNVLRRQFKQTDGLVAISRATADDLVALCGAPANRVHLIYPSYDPAYRPALPAEIQEMRTRYGLGELEYLLHVGNFSVKKNLTLLLDAFMQFRRQSGFAGRLVLVGSNYHKGRDDLFFDRLAQPELREAVVLTGPVPQEHLMSLYSGSLALLLPSLHEGFGLVLLEAMVCGTPVIAHAAGAVREVVGDAGEVIESAADVSVWREAISKIVFDSALRERLVQAGFERARLFTSERAAQQTIELYNQICSNNVE